MKRNIMETNIISELTTFIEHAPTAFHAVAELKDAATGTAGRFRYRDRRSVLRTSVRGNGGSTAGHQTAL